jgi:hypothetical protein
MRSTDCLPWINCKRNNIFVLKMDLANQEMSHGLGSAIRVCWIVAVVLHAADAAIRGADQDEFGVRRGFFEKGIDGLKEKERA